MARQNEQFLRRLQATFRVEAREHLQTMATGLVRLKDAPLPDLQRELIESVFRAAHSLKGAARAVEMEGVESICQSLEGMFSEWRQPDCVPRFEQFESAHRQVDVMANLLDPPQAATPAGTPAAPPDSADIIRLPVAKLDARLAAADDMLEAKLIAGRQAQSLRELAGRFTGWRRDWDDAAPHFNALQRGLDRVPDAHSVRALLQLVERQRELLDSVAVETAALAQAAQQDNRTVGKLVETLLQDSKSLRLVPFATLTGNFARVVRDLCRDLQKEADFEVRGEAVGIDKRVLDGLRDPLIHLLRNAVDHGIESPADRQRLGKPARGMITLSAAQAAGNRVEIAVSDDGGGIDVGAVKAAAVRQGVLAAHDAGRLDDAQAHELVFRSALSTRESVTRLSGHGLGLAIAREGAGKLGGNVTVESRAGQGTTFRFLLPAMLASFRGVLVQAGGHRFVVPTVNVDQVARVRADTVRSIEGRQMVTVAGKALAMIRLEDLLELPVPPVRAASTERLTLVVLGAGAQRIACVVDAIDDVQEVLVKPLRRPLVRVRNIAGAAVLGSGKVTPVLNVTDLLESARNVRAASAAPAMTTRSEKLTVLVAEDSITSRMLIRGMLESAGYDVRTAVDGMDALMQLRLGAFDLLVSDVEMPRLDGFALTSAVRADRRLAELPVVLITARESREDRERGVDAGASAYLVKSGLDQDGLLETVRRLV
jgi:two-component system chemotaxis sensor kinase CheA